MESQAPQPTYFRVIISKMYLGSVSKMMDGMMSLKSEFNNKQAILSLLVRLPLTIIYLLIAGRLFDINVSPAIAQETRVELKDSGKSSYSNAGQINENSFRDSKAWARRLDGIDRDKWQKPDEVINKLLITNQSIVADIGAGTGYFSTRIAARYPKSKIYAVDLSSEMLDYIKERANNENLSNIHVIKAAKSGPNLPEKVDLVLLVNAYAHKDDPINYFTMLKQYLKDDGRVALIFFNESAERGPPKNMRIPEASALEYMQKAGYTLLSSHKLIPDEYFLVFSKQ